KGKTPVEVYNEVKTAYGDKGMNRTSVFKWCREFKNGRTSVHDDQRSGRPSILTDDIVEKKENALRDDRRLTMDELSAMFPQISRSLLHETITETLGYRKLSARWVPKQLTDQHKLNRVEAGQEFLRRYKLHGDEFLRSIVTGDETWFSTDEEVKGEGEKWTNGLAGNYFEEGIQKLIPRFTTCIERNALKEKRPLYAQRHDKVILLHDNARGHVAKPVKTYLETLKWERIEFLDTTCRDWFRRFKNNDFQLEDKERSGAPKKFQDKELEQLLDEDPSQTLSELGKILQVDESTVSKRLKGLGMIQKQGHWVPYELKPRDVERRFGTCELLLQRQKRKGFLAILRSSDISCPSSESRRAVRLIESNHPHNDIAWVLSRAPSYVSNPTRFRSRDDQPFESIVKAQLWYSHESRRGAEYRYREIGRKKTSSVRK
ncbi:MOS1T transposase, partial [Pseudoatta argentina]